MVKKNTRGSSYELKTWQQLGAGFGFAERSSVHFDAHDDEAATSTARSHLRQLEASDFLALHRSDGTRFWTGQAPSANGPPRSGWLPHVGLRTGAGVKQAMP